jgi:hypothetical protein
MSEAGERSEPRLRRTPSPPRGRSNERG